MPRPPDARIDSFVDAVALAQAGSAVQRTYLVEHLPRLAAAGALTGSEIRADLRFSEFDGQPAVDGRLSGQLVLTCQRCMSSVALAVEEQFQVLVVPQERVDEPGGYEPFVADPARLDLRWMVEDQALLGLPLVPMHAPESCAAGEKGEGESRRGGSEGGAVQRPFQNLRDIMRKR